MAEPLTGIRVLLIEDHEDSRDLLAESLQFQGAAVMAVATAEQAVPKLADADIIVTDYLLPAADGVRVLEQVNASGHIVPVIALSGFAESQLPRLASSPFARKLLKPVDPWDLGLEILNVLRPTRTAS